LFCFFSQSGKAEILLRKHQMSQEEQRVFLNAFNSIFFGMGIKDLQYVGKVQFLLGSA
jgi:hypothetical protein